MKSAVAVAEGEYRYLCNGDPVNLSETWSLHKCGAYYRLDSVRHIPDAGIMIRAHAELDRGTLQRCLVDWSSAGSGADRDRYQSRARVFFRGAVSGGRYRFRNTGRRAVFEPVGDAFLFPLLRIFSGHLFQRMLQKPDGARVVVPWIKNPQETNHLFAPSYSDRSLEWVAGFSVDQAIDGSPSATFARCAQQAGLSGEIDEFQYCGDQYGDNTRYWLIQGLLLGYQWQQGNDHWQIELCNSRGVWPEDCFPCLSRAGIPD